MFGSDKLNNFYVQVQQGWGTAHALEVIHQLKL